MPPPSRPDPRRDVPIHDEPLPADDGARRALLRQLAAGERRLGRQAMAAIVAEGAAGTRRNLRLDVAGALAVELHDRPLYLAAAIWHGEDKRGLWTALETYSELAERILGYGLLLLAGEHGDPQAAWRPFGAWVFGRAAGWTRLRRRLGASRRVAEALAAAERGTAPWARRFTVLTVLAGHERQVEFETLLRLAAEHGDWFTRIRARGALDRVERLQAAARAEAEKAQAVALAAPPSYPELIPLSHFDDVPTVAERRPELGQD